MKSDTRDRVIIASLPSSEGSSSIFRMGGPDGSGRILWIRWGAHHDATLRNREGFEHTKLGTCLGTYLECSLTAILGYYLYRRNGAIALDSETGPFYGYSFHARERLEDSSSSLFLLIIALKRRKGMFGK